MRSVHIEPLPPTPWSRTTAASWWTTSSRRSSPPCPCTTARPSPATSRTASRPASAAGRPGEPWGPRPPGSPANSDRDIVTPRKPGVSTARLQQSSEVAKSCQSEKDHICSATAARRRSLSRRAATRRCMSARRCALALGGCATASRQPAEDAQVLSYGSSSILRLLQPHLDFKVTGSITLPFLRASPIDCQREMDHPGVCKHLRVLGQPAF